MRLAAIGLVVGALQDSRETAGAWRQAGKNFRLGKDAFGEDELA